jgi:hypothetical protein
MSAAAAPAVAQEAVAKVVATAAVVAAVQAAVDEKEATVAAAVPVPTPSPAVIDGTIDVFMLRDSVLETLEAAQQEMLATFIDTPEWSLESGELVIKVAKSQMMIDMSISAEAKKTIAAALQKAAGRPLKFKVIGGGTASATQQPHRSTARASSGSARSRAAEHPLVRYFQEKFSAEIRTVVDQQRDEE